MNILFTGRDIPYNSLNPATEIATMFGFIKNENGNTTIANRIFETIFYNFYLAIFFNKNLPKHKKSGTICARLKITFIFKFKF